MIEPGQPAPDFTLPDQDGNEVSLADLRGQTVVLAFYPLDFSPVCTDQLNVYQEVLADLEAAGAKLYGVSVDSAFAHKAFQQHLGITIPLLADFHPKGEVARRYQVWRDTDGFSERALFVIDPHGRITYRHVSPYLHHIPDLDELLAAVDAARTVQTESTV